MQTKFTKASDADAAVQTLNKGKEGTGQGRWLVLMKNDFYWLKWTPPGEFVPTVSDAVVDWEVVNFLRRNLDTA